VARSESELIIENMKARRVAIRSIGTNIFGATHLWSKILGSATALGLLYGLEHTLCIRAPK
jgi:hypothetical protein